MSCIHCGNPPTAPNYLLTYDDDFGQEYDICAMCSDFETDYCEADVATRGYMAGAGYESWQARWHQEMDADDRARGGDEA